MKTRRGIAISVLAASLSLSASGQGLILFNNRVTTTLPAVDAPIFHGGVLASGTDQTLRAALLGGPTNRIPVGGVVGGGTLTMLASPSTSATWVTFRTGAAAGYVAVGTDSARDSGLPYGSMGMFQVVAWEGTQTTWFDAWQAATLGQTAVSWSKPLILPVTTGPLDLNTPALIGLNSFDLHDHIPEPSSFAMGCLGFAALLAVRWQRRHTR